MIKKNGGASILRSRTTAKDESPTLQMMINEIIKLRNTQYAIRDTSKKGIALLVVLFIIMAITILSLGFLSGSDVELACGQNMILRTQMDYLAESGLEHARGLILNPQDLAAEYWTGDSNLQLVDGSKDFYDVRIIRDENEPNNYCNYNIECDAYRRLADGSEVGRSSLKTVLRLDPCIALWMGADTTLWSEITTYGDVYCNGTLTNQGNIYGDVFADDLIGVPMYPNQEKSRQVLQDLSFIWPPITISYSNPEYSSSSIGPGTLSDSAFQPACIWHCTGDLVLGNNVTIDGMLLVDGDLTVSGIDNVIVAGKNLPALYVTGDLMLESNATLDVNGLAVVTGDVFIRPDNTRINILGGLFIRGKMAQVTVDSSGYQRKLVLYNEPTWRPSGGYISGALEFDGTNDKAEDPCAPGYINGLSALTVSLWVKSDVTDQDRGIFFTSSPTGADEELGLRYDKDGAYGHAEQCIKASIRTNIGYTQIESSSHVQTTSWQYLALVWQSGFGLKLYIDSNVPDSLTYDMDEDSRLVGTTAGVQKFMLGLGTKGKYWDGLIDDVRIYNRALDPNEIYPPQDVSGLIAHWCLDDSGNNAIATITAAPAKTAILVGPQDAQQRWGQAAGAFFRSIQRK